MAWGIISRATQKLKSGRDGKAKVTLGRGLEERRMSDGRHALSGRQAGMWEKQGQGEGIRPEK